MWWLGGMAALKGVQAVAGMASADDQARRQRAEGREYLRRMTAQHAVELGQAGAAEGASGLVTGASSLSQHIATMADEFRRQEAWAWDAARRGASATVQAGWWNGIGDVGSALFSVGQAANWGRK